MKYRVIAISGKICTGKSSLFKDLCQKLGWESYSASQFFRGWCLKRNLPLFAAHLRPDKLTREVDQEMKDALLGGEKLIAEGWLAGFTAQDIPQVLKILLTCEDRERAKRFAQREKISLAKAHQEIQKREANLFQKWKRVYGRQDFLAPKLYDLVIETSHFSPKEVLNLVLEKLEGKEKGRKTRAVTADGLVIQKEKILLVRRNHGPYKGFWAIPGGYVELGETCEEAVVREIREETGLETKIKRIMGVYSAPSRDPRQTITVAYLLEIKSGRVQKSEEATDIKWFSLNKLPPLAFDHQEIIKDCVKKLFS